MDQSLLGKWVQTSTQQYPGLSFEFKDDGTFEALFEPMAIVSSGTWETQGDEMDMDQTQHTFGLVGKFIGRYEIDGDLLKMNLVAAGEHARPENLVGAVVYEKAKEE